MNSEKLKQAEYWFLNRYPGGFLDPELQVIAKKHKVDKMSSTAQDFFSKRKYFRDTSDIIDNMIKLVSRSSMVSVFEKPKFKSFLNSLSPKERNQLVAGLKEQLHGNEQAGFEKILHILNSGKLGKWTLISILPAYFRPQQEVFVKPTTTKGVITHFELDTVHYKPSPSWAFYAEYRDIINGMKTQVDPSLSPNSAAFTGFLMMSMAAMADL
jgi:hypothetical protein